MQSEDTITVKLVDVLENMRTMWQVEPQNPHTFREVHNRPDFTVKERGRNPVVAEVKIDGRRPDYSGEAQTQAHLGRELSSFEVVTTALAVRFPFRFRQVRHQELAQQIRDAADLHYILLSGYSPEQATRVPSEGWFRGKVSDIATAIRIGATPTSEVLAAASDLEIGVDKTAKWLADAIEKRPEIAKQLESILYQKSGIQTYRMAMLIISNAFVFQSSLARTQGMEDVPTLLQLQAYGQPLDVANIFAAWDKIYQVNYRPIFDVATKLITVLASDDTLVGTILWELLLTAQRLIQRGVAQVHELAGIVFQRLIVDRKFIKTYYTRPESVALMSGLVLPDIETADNDLQAIRTQLASTKIADFACGTGALLNGAYQRLLGLYEHTGGIAKTIHKQMVEQNLFGYDIMPNASHLTAALITSNFPDVRIGETRVEVLEYSTELTDGSRALGALNLLHDTEQNLPVPIMNPERVHGGATPQQQNDWTLKHRTMDIVVDNPPFTRAGADNNATSADVPKTIFGEQDPQIANEMKKALANMNSLGNNSAGFSSYFVDLAHRMLKENGKSVMGFVLPITCLPSPDWKNIRKLWAEKYHNLIVFTIADAQTDKCSFSADTNMAECIVVATKGETDTTGRGRFVCLHKRPKSHLEAQEIAKTVRNIKRVNALEDSPVGGTPITIGTQEIGTALDCPLNEQWTATRTRDLSLIQTAYHLKNNILWLPEQFNPIDIHMTTIGELATIQYDSNKIVGGKGAFSITKNFHKITEYPGLWHVNANEQRTMEVEPDSNCRIIPFYWTEAQEVLKRNSRTHHMAKLRFNANSHAVLFTEEPAIGINTIPNVKFHNTDYDYPYTLWANSTLGLLCYWIHGNKQHSGRGQIRLTALATMPTLDYTQLDQNALNTAKNVFNQIKNTKMLPFNQIDQDKERHKLDTLLLQDILGFKTDTHQKIHHSIKILRERLAKEPSIHGAKKSRVVL